jgi:hypothetical protein
MVQTIDVSGLPEGVVQDIQKLVTDIRQNLPQGHVAPISSDLESAAEWVAKFRAWAESHPKRDIALDDSRESIYAGRGE